jgi:hypothetical protein
MYIDKDAQDNPRDHSLFSPKKLALSFLALQNFFVPSLTLS